MSQRIPPSDWPRLLTLVEQALDLPPAQRDGWVQALHLPGPLETALRGLLDERQAVEASNFLAALPALSGGEAHIPPRFVEGALIGPWRLQRELGQGGMSVVWLARRSDGQVERTVALKLPHAGPGQDLLARRMLRERKILAALEHPHIARLYDVGVTDDGTPYLVMEFVRGVNLMAHADAQRLGIRDRLALFQQVLAAVQYAHGKLVLHSDLKPNNILVGADGQVKLLDFGIAKMLVDDTGTAAETELTGTIDRRMTPGYASPEQLAGQHLGTASDVYSLGVLLCELLCGQRPHARAGRSLAQLEAAVLGDEVRPPSRLEMGPAALHARATTTAALARLLRGDLDAIVVKALAPTPERRYATVDALAADLTAWLDGRPVVARGPGAWYLFSKFVRRHRLALGLGSVAAVVLVASSAVAIVQRRDAQQQATRAAAARDFMLQLFDEAAPHRVGGVQLTAMQLLARGRYDATQRLKHQPLLQAELLAGIGETQQLAGEAEGAEAALAQAASLFRQAGDAVQEASARITRLRVAVWEKRFDTVDQLRRDLEPLLPTIRNDRHLYTRWLNVEGRYARLVRNDVQERQRFRECIEAADLSDPWQAAMAFDAHMGLAATLMFEDGNLDASQAELAAAEAIPAAGRHLTPADKSFRLTEARVEFDFYLGRVRGLADWLPPAIASCEANMGRDDDRCLWLKEYLLSAYLLQGPSYQAFALARALEPTRAKMSSPGSVLFTALLQTQALASYGRTGPEEGPIADLAALLSAGGSSIPIARQMPGLITMAQVRLRAGDFAGARQWFARAEKLVDQAGGERRIALPRLRYAQGLLAQATGDHALALSLMADHCTSPRPRIVSTLFSLNCVRSFAATGQMPAALALVRAAVPRLTEGLGVDAPYTVAARSLLAELEAAGGYRPPPWKAEQIFFID